MMSDLPLDETALQATAEKMWGGDEWEAAGRCYPWDVEMADCQEAVEQVRLGISTYLKKAGFELEIVHVYPSGAHSGGFVAIGSDPPEALRLASPWKSVPVVRAESEEK